MLRTTRRGATRRTALAAGIAALALTATACGSSSNSSSDPKGSTDKTPAAVADAPAGTFAGKAATGTPVKVGLMNPEGGQAVNMPESRVAAEAAVAYANANLGGLGGHKIELDICKTKEEDPSNLTACANQMVQDKVVGLVEGNTGNGSLIVPIITKAGMAYTSYTAASPEEIATPGSYIWTGGVPGVTIAMAKTAAGAGVKSFTIFVTSNALASVQAMAEPTFKAAGIALNVTSIPVGTADASPQVAAGLKSNPGAVAIVGDSAMCSATLKGLQTVGSSATRYVIQPCMDASVYKAVPTELDGSMLFTTSATDGSDDEAKIYQAVMAKYAPSGAELGGAAASGYQSMLGFIRAVNAGISGQDVTAATVLKAIAAAKDVPLPLGDGIKMTCDGKQLPQMPAICSAGQAVGKVEGGKVPAFTIVS